MIGAKSAVQREPVQGKCRLTVAPAFAGIPRGSDTKGFTQVKNALPFIILVAVVTGCATTKDDSSHHVSETLPVSRATLKSFGTIALVSAPQPTPAFTFFTHHSKYEAADAILNGMFSGASHATNQTASKPSVVVLPLTGVSPKEIARVTNALRSVVAASPLQPGFNKLIAELALRDHQMTIQTTGQTSQSDTLISVKQFSHGLLRAEGTNPPVVLHGSLMVTAHRRRDGELLAVVPLDYRSPAHRLSEWAANDAAIFRRELETFRQRCAATIVHWLYDGKD